MYIWNQELVTSNVVQAKNNSELNEWWAILPGLPSDNELCGGGLFKTLETFELGIKYHYATWYSEKNRHKVGLVLSSSTISGAVVFNVVHQPHLGSY
jgi:hypothetical protein